MDFTPTINRGPDRLTAEIASSISTPERVAELEAAAAPLTPICGNNWRRPGCWA